MSAGAGKCRDEVRGMEYVSVTIVSGHFASSHVLHTRAGRERISMKRSMLYIINRLFGSDRRENSVRAHIRWLRGMPHDGGGLRHNPALLSLILLLVSTSAAAQQAEIGIYNDANRSSCSLSDAGAGLISAYVVVNSNGLTGVRFSIPKPDCFNAVWVGENSDFPLIGDSQTDISIAMGTCAQGATHVLTIMYQKSSSTAACCEIQVKAAQGQSDIQYSDCSFVERPMAAKSAFINGNATCACTPGLNLAPTAPQNPFPSSGINNVQTDVIMRWESSDPEHGALHYDLYLGTSPNPPLAASYLTEASYSPPPLASRTLYYWKVVAFDPDNLSTEGPVWTFTTGVPVPPPGPTDPAPFDNAVDQNRALTLAWSSSATTSPRSYEVHFGTTTTPPVVATVPALDRTTYPVDSLTLDTRYYWQVVSLGGGGERTEGPVWTFRTWATNPAPSIPGSPQPANLARHVPTAATLSWLASDPESQALAYDLYFGTDNNPAFLAHSTSSHFDVTNLVYNKDYYWRVVVFDAEGASTSGPTWTFHTQGDQPPTVPVLIAPALESVVSPFNGYLEWSAQDPEGDPLHFDVYVGTTADPPSVVTNFSGNRIDFSIFNLAAGTTYYWRVSARDSDNLVTDGPLWTFQTKAVTPPDPPSDPAPVDGAVDVFRLPVLRWHSSDPDDQALHYVVRLGTSQSSGQDYESETDSLQVERPLAIGTQYYWRVTAIDTDNSSTVGPWWTFTTPTSDLPPTAPASPDPADHATGQGSTVMLQWSATDAEGLPLTYTVCFGSTPSPPQIANHWPKNSYTMYDLPSKDWYWLIVAHDVDGNSTFGPQWTFHTGGVPSPLSIGMYSDAAGTSCSLADNAGLKNIYVVLDGPSTYTGVRFAAPRPSCFNATWMFDSSPYVKIGDSPTDVSLGFGMCLDTPLPIMTITYMSLGNTIGCCQFQAQASPVVGKMLATDCSFEELVAVGTPLGISSDNSCPSCESAGFLHFAETEDSCSGAGAPHRITVALDLNTAIATDNGGVDIVLSPSLQFISCERGDLTRNWTAFNHELNGNVLTISASGGLIPSGVAGSFALVTLETDCCEWTSPAELGLTDPLGDFTSTRLGNKYLECRYPPNGDVDNDGNLNLADAQCALESYLYWPISSPGGCGRQGASMRADVNCSDTPTPGDADCIYRQLLDQSCTFCNGEVHTPSGAAPQLALRSIVEDQDVVVVLSSSVANSISTLGLELTFPKELQFLRVEASRNDVFAALQTRVVEPGRVRIGGYANSGTALSGDGDLIAFRFRARPGHLHGSAKALQFVDDLAGASSVSIPLENTIGSPVPGQVVLHQNSPNPFNPQTTIRFELPSVMRVQLSIFDVHGRLVRTLIDEQRGAGASTAEWNGRDDKGAAVATGVYFYVLEAGGSRSQRKMVLLK